jgi:hypothetical protein
MRGAIWIITHYYLECVSKLGTHSKKKELSMFDTRDIQEGILIEAKDLRIPVREVYNGVKAQRRGLSDKDCRSLASNIIGSMVSGGLVKLVRMKSRKLGSSDNKFFSCYEFESERGLTPEETKLILKEPERWKEMDVFSMTEAYLLAMTRKGRKLLKRHGM